MIRLTLLCSATTTPKVRICCGCASPAALRAHLRSVRWRLSRRVGRPVSSVVSHWIPKATCARVPTAITRTDGIAVTEQSFELSAAEVRTVLTEGDLAIEGRLIDASNTTLYAVVTHSAVSLTCVYKPIAGERPLWDFPDGTLAGREVGAYLVSEATGWDVVPPTVMRDGPLGPGACQLWIDTDGDADVMALLPSNHPGLRRMAVFDAVVNNADRKGGHLLPTLGGHIYGVDHGVCFSSEDKLRTVLWQWRGTALPDDRS